MDIVLDSNIFCSDFLMNSKKFQLVYDYLKKTNSKIIIPQLVFQEVAALYERELASRLGKYRTSKESLQIILIEKTMQEMQINYKEETERYLKFFKDKLKISDKDIFCYKDEYLKEIVKRAIYRVKPCTEKGEEFRDALLWLTVLDIARLTKNNELIFISNDIRQFSDGKNSLHPDLFKEIENAKIQIKYYQSLGQFIEAHAVKIDFITKNWLSSVLSIDIIDKEVIKILEAQGEKRLLEWVEGHEDKSTTGYFNPITPFIDLDTFYVYEKTDGSYYVEVNYYGEVEVEFEFEFEEEEAGIKYEYKYDPISGDFDFEPVYHRERHFKAETKCLLPQIRVTVGIDIQDMKIANYEIIGWEI